MGVLPLQFRTGESAQTLGIDCTESFNLEIPASLAPQQDLELSVTRKNGEQFRVRLLCRIDTPIEVDYFRHGGILPYVLRELMAA